jgi:hypothetical protein
MRSKVLRLCCSVIVACAFMGIVHAQNAYWSRHVIDASLSGADGVRIADINYDGLTDITTGWEEAGYTKVYLHPGYNRVKEKWPSVIVGATPAVEDAVFADLDNDGAIDVISSTEGHSRKIYINWAPRNPDDYLDPAKWICEILPPADGRMQWMFVVPMQVDGKNGIDLIAGAKGVEAKIGWFESPEDPHNLSGWKWHPIGPATWVMSLILRDMDNDDDLDIVISDRKPGVTNGVRWLENPGPGQSQAKEWENHFIGVVDREVMFMDIADMDGDGWEDALVTEYTNQKIVFVRRLDSTGLHWEEFEIDIPNFAGRAKAVRIGDIDMDGIPDIVHSANTLGKEQVEGVFWLSAKYGVTNTEWAWHKISGPEGYKFDRLELLDLDGDGDLDVLTCEENFGADSRGLGVIWYENPIK